LVAEKIGKPKIIPIINEAVFALNNFFIIFRQKSIYINVIKFMMGNIYNYFIVSKIYENPNKTYSPNLLSLNLLLL